MRRQPTHGAPLMLWRWWSSKEATKQCATNVILATAFSCIGALWISPQMHLTVELAVFKSINQMWVDHPICLVWAKQLRPPAELVCIFFSFFLKTMHALRCGARLTSLASAWNAEGSRFNARQLLLERSGGKWSERNLPEIGESLLVWGGQYQLMVWFSISNFRFHVLPI